MNADLTLLKRITNNPGLPVTDTAQLLGCSRTYVYHLIERQKLKVAPSYGSFLISLASIVQFLETKGPRSGKKSDNL
jgi:hypothetical protein